MLVTEDEAKTKWCPQARVQIFNEPAPQSAPNRAWSEKEGSFVPHAAGCIASRCMFWRWSHGTGIEPGTPKLGYCGAGGQP